MWKYRELRQTRLVSNYVKKFTTIMLDIRDMTKKGKLFAFFKDLTEKLLWNFKGGEFNAL